MPIISTPSTIVTNVVVIPIMPVAIPRTIIIPSLPIRPNEVIRIPIPGRKFVKGKGIKMETENSKIKNPKILSHMPVLRNKNLGFRNFSILLKEDEDFSMIVANIFLSMVLFDMNLGNIGALNPHII